MLADVLKRSGELQLAARHLFLAATADAVHDLGSEASQYLDVTGYLDEPAYWVRASALRLIAAQADLVPDDQVAAIAGRAFTVLDHAQAGELRDTPFFAPPPSSPLTKPSPPSASGSPHPRQHACSTSWNR
jgi:hypothetical protein